MSLKDRIVTEGMKLASNPQVTKLMQDERFMKLVMTAMSMPGRVTTFTAEQKEQFARTMGLATADEVRDLKRIVTSLEQSVARLRVKIEAKTETKPAAKAETQTTSQTNTQPESA